MPEKEGNEYVLMPDIKSFFPGVWEKMSPEERAKWREEWRKYNEKRKNNHERYQN